MIFLQRYSRFRLCGIRHRCFYGRFEPTAMSWSQRDKSDKNAGGLGIPTVKPWNIERSDPGENGDGKDSGFAVAMDLSIRPDCRFLKNLTPPAGGLNRWRICVK